MRLDFAPGELGRPLALLEPKSFRRDLWLKTGRGKACRIWRRRHCGSLPLDAPAEPTLLPKF